MDSHRLTEENLGMVYELARSHLASLIHEHLAHETVPDNQRWNLDDEVARNNLPLYDFVLWAWTRDFVNFLTYVGHWELYDEMHRRELTLQESGGLSSGDYVRGLSDEEFYKHMEQFSWDQKRFLFGKIAGQRLWDSYAFPLINRGNLRSQGFYPRERLAA